MNSVVMLFARALRGHCPNCGGGPIFASWFKLRPICPTCGLRLERDEGYWLGGMTVNLVIGEVLPVLGVVVWGILTSPSPPWDAILYVWIAAAIACPLLFFPLSRTLWLAFDLSFHPADAAELDRNPPLDPR